MSNASMEPGAKGGVKDRCPLNSQVDRAGHIESLKHSHNERQREAERERDREAERERQRGRERTSKCRIILLSFHGRTLPSPRGNWQILNLSCF